MARAARDIRFDDVLARACQEDRKNYCNDVQPVGAGFGANLECYASNEVPGKLHCRAASEWELRAASGVQAALLWLVHICKINFGLCTFVRSRDPFTHALALPLAPAGLGARHPLPPRQPRDADGDLHRGAV